MPRVASKSALVAPSFTAIATPWMTSPASGPIMCAPTTRCEARSTISFMKVRSPVSVSVSLRARNEVLYTSIAPWALRAASSDSPTLARFGLAKTAVGTLAWSTGVGWLRNSVLASHIAEALADLGVEAAQQPAAAVRERGGHSHAVEDRGELHRDVAAADHQRARGQLLEVEGFVRRDGELGSGDLRQARPGAGRHQDVP